MKLGRRRSSVSVGAANELRRARTKPPLLAFCQPYSAEIVAFGDRARLFSGTSQGAPPRSRRTSPRHLLMSDAVRSVVFKDGEARECSCRLGPGEFFRTAIMA
jgi:hypothetical protein